MSFPDEVLALVFNKLGTTDLVQCQLTSIQWHRVSLRLLYSFLLGDEKRAHKYARTISYSPQLGEYLNAIYFTDPFESDAQFKDTSLLDRIIEYCPNITSLDGFVYDNRLWPRLMKAASQGQLLRLESLPRPQKPTLKLYINAALAFKNNLTDLWVSNHEVYSQFADSATYGAIYDQIDQFKNLTTLYLECFSGKYLSYFDELIDKCHSLKTIDFYTENIKEIQQTDEPRPTIRPRPDIRSLKCCWEQINLKSQLEYLMCKFPNLHSLKVERWRGEFGCSGTALLKFIQYALSIPTFELIIEADKKDILNIWDEFTKTKNGCKNVALNYLEYDPSSTMYRLELDDELGWHLGFILHPDVDELPHLQFLSEASKSLRSVTIADASLFQRIIDETSTTIAWIFDILQLCPLLEELIVSNPTHLSPIHHTIQYPSVKRLTIDKLKSIESISFLHCLSLSLPNLCRLSLSLIYKNTDPVIIDMPHTSFDLLIWDNEPYYERFLRESEVYVKLNTAKGLEYYLGKKSKLFPISQRRYLLSPKNFRFDISCKHLKELRIRTLPELDCHFVF